MRKNNYNNWYPQQPGTQQPDFRQPGMQQQGMQQPGFRQPGAGNRPPWMMHPKKRGIPKFARKLLTILIILALLVLGVYIYYTLNPSVGRLVKF